MGAKQSGPAAANGRTRAYSGSDLPSSSSSSGGANGTAGGGARAAAAGRFPAQVPSAHQPSASGGAAAASAAPRSRSLGGAVGTVASGARAAQSTFSIPNSSSGPYGSQDSVHSSPEDGGSSGGRDRPASGGPGGPRLVIGSLPAHLSPHMFGGTALSLSASRRRHVGRGCAYFYPSPFLLQPERRGFAVRPGRVTLFGVGGKERGRERLLTPAAPLPRDPSVWFLNTACTLTSSWLSRTESPCLLPEVKGANIVLKTNAIAGACGF